MLSVALFPLAMSLVVRKFSIDHLLVPITDIEFITFSEWMFLYPFNLYYPLGSTILQPTQFYLLVFYGIFIGIALGILLVPYTHIFPITAEESFQQTTVAPLTFDSVVEHIEKEEVMKTFGFSPSLTQRDKGVIIFRRHKSEELQLFLRVQKVEPPSETRIDMLGYQRGRYVALASPLAKEVV